MKQYIDKATVVAQANIEITNLRIAEKDGFLTEYGRGMLEGLEGIVDFINTLEVKDADLESENENNNPKITIGTKIRSKLNPVAILSIISNDCHEDEFECSNGSVLSLKQIEKYYDIVK